MDIVLGYYSRLKFKINVNFKVEGNCLGLQEYDAYLIFNANI
jgi:hypothetical protein